MRDHASALSIKYCEVFIGDIVVTFKDGVAAIYSATLMRSFLDQAELVPEDLSDPD